MYIYLLNEGKTHERCISARKTFHYLCCWLLFRTDCKDIVHKLNESNTKCVYVCMYVHDICQFN